MSESPQRCPTCGIAVTEGAHRCPGCGRVFGEENRCPHCHAIAAVIQRGGITVCAACGKARAGNVVLGGGRGSIVAASASGRSASTAAMLSRGRGRLQRGFGVLALTVGVLAAILATAVFPGALGLVLALVVGILGVGLGALSIRAGARSMRSGDHDDRTAREAAVLELAHKSGGKLTATDVARAFGIGAGDADALLTRMVGDGTRVSVDVDDEGVVRYVFRELAPPPQVRVHVETEEPQDAEVPKARAERGGARQVD